MKIQEHFWAKKELLSKKTLNYNSILRFSIFLQSGKKHTNYGSFEWLKTKLVNQQNISSNHQEQKSFSAKIFFNTEAKQRFANTCENTTKKQLYQVS